MSITGSDTVKFTRRSLSNLILKFNTEKTIFLFNNADPFICKKLGHFIYEAFNIRETCNFI